MRASAGGAHALAAALWLLAGAATPAALADGGERASMRAAADEVDAGERLLMHLSERLLRLRPGLLSLRLPDPAARELFAADVEVIDLGAAESVPSSLPPHFEVASRHWPAASRADRVDRSQLRLWRSLLGRFVVLETVAIETLDGEWADAAHTSFRSRHRIRARGRPAAGGSVFLRAAFELRWRDHRGESTDADWRIVSWRSQPAVEHAARQRFFDEALAQMLPRAADLARARRSIHEEHVVAYLRDPAGFTPPDPRFDTVSHDRHPAVSVVDIDRDGWDDLYVMARWGPNMLLRNRGRGPDGQGPPTFEEVAAEVGLDLSDHTSCAIFADFDNDGDADVFLGRTLERGRFLFQHEGRFVERSASERPLPMLVVSASAADYDGDGLLDLYLSTYSKRLSRGLAGKAALAVDPELPLPDDATLAAMARDHHDFLNVWGPANVLLRNVGDGRFVDATEEAGLMVWRHTYQATWSDYDLDGDPDLYLANDYAPNHLFRNRGADDQGRVTFEDVTIATGTADLGFGMGAAWGDVDHDGRPDLYVSNMYSKAGTRITRKIPGLDPAFSKMARGNTLLRNLGDRFEVASGSSPPAMLVERAGWSWGSQFLDVDHDGWLDLAVANGYYTVPEEVSVLPVDT